MHPGATRRCIFTNGEFVEPVEVWDAPRELRFGVEAMPPNVAEYLAVEGGQFLLTDNGDGTTTLDGTTWYRLKVFPTGLLAVVDRYIFTRHPYAGARAHRADQRAPRAPAGVGGSAAGVDGRRQRDLRMHAPRSNWRGRKLI